MAGMTGFEPATSRSQSERSDQAELHPINIELGKDSHLATTLPASEVRCWHPHKQFKNRNRFLLDIHDQRMRYIVHYLL